MSNTNRAVQPQKMAGDLKFRRDFTLSEAKTKALVTMQLICAFVFAYAESRFSCDKVHLSYETCENSCF